MQGGGGSLTPEPLRTSEGLGVSSTDTHRFNLDKKCSVWLPRKETLFWVAQYFQYLELVEYLIAIIV